MRSSVDITTVSGMSDDTTPPPPSEGAVPPPPPPLPSYGSVPPPPGGYGAPVPSTPPSGAPAEWLQRVLATLIDAAPIIAIVIVEQILFAIMPGVIDVLVALAATAAIIGWWVYNYGIQQGTTGYTLGKGYVGIKLIGEQTGQPVGTGMAIARGFVHIIDALPCYIGYVWPLWDEKKQTFTDKVLNHAVITAPKA